MNLTVKRICAYWVALVATWGPLADAAWAQPPAVPLPVINAEPSATAAQIRALEREKFEFQKQLEAQKLEIEKYKAWLTAGSVFLPLALGVATLLWQTRTANAHKERDANEAFQLKAIDVMFKTDSNFGVLNRARALSALFPGRLQEGIANAFDPQKFGGPRYEAKVEVFQAACAKVTSPAEVYAVWQRLFPGDEWIKLLLDNPGPTVVPKPRRPLRSQWQR